MLYLSPLPYVSLVHTMFHIFTFSDSAVTLNPSLLLRSDLDVPREEQEDESGGQLSTVLTRTRAGSTRVRPEETRDSRS